jgi:hypothetical protein
LRFTFRCNFAHQNRARLHLGADADDAALIQVAKHVFTDVGNVAGNFFRPQLRIAGFDLELLNVNRGVVILFHQTFGHEDRVFEVVTAPWHEGDENVSAEGKLTAVRARPIGDHLTFFNAFAHVHDGTLIDAGILI